MNELTRLQHDAITELINLARGKAADSLSKMVNQQVILDVPYFKLISQSDLIKEFEQSSMQCLAKIKQSISGDIAGDILLVFPEEKSFELVKLLLGDEVAIARKSEIEQEALKEVANVVLNAFSGTIANTLGISITSSLPKIMTSFGFDLFNNKKNNDEDEQCLCCLFIQVDFEIRSHAIKGYIVLIFEFASISSFLNRVDDFILQATG